MKIILTIMILAAAALAQSITGTVTYADTARPVVNAAVRATWSGGHIFTTTDADGRYTLTGFTAGESYTVTVIRNADPNVAVSSFDASLIGQFATGVISFTPTQILAADVSNNGLISNFDAGMTARYSLGLMNHGITGTWKFLPSGRVYSLVAGTTTDQNYAAVLMGDVSQNWIHPSPTAWPVYTPGLSPSPTPIAVPFPSITPSPCPPEVCG